MMMIGTLLVLVVPDVPLHFREWERNIPSEHGESFISMLQILDT